MAQPHKNKPKKIDPGALPTDTDGKLYRVRDKDFGDGQPVIVWAENLTYEEAHALKEKVVGGGKSDTARAEDMTIPPPATATRASAVITAPAPRPTRTPARSAVVTAQSAKHPDPAIQAAREKAMAAARPIAQQAQSRAAAKAAEAVIEEDSLVPAGEDLDGDEFAAAAAEAEEVFAILDGKGKMLWDFARQIDPTTRMSRIEWTALDEPTKAGIRWEADAKQGTYVDSLWRAYRADLEIGAMSRSCPTCHMAAGEVCKPAEVSVTPTMGAPRKKVSIPSMCAARGSRADVRPHVAAAIDWLTGADLDAEYAVARGELSDGGTTDTAPAS